jgi:hypothetical protein
MAPGLLARLLGAVAAAPVNVDTAEIGLDVLGDRLGADIPRAALAEAVAEGVRRGLLHDPVRLPPGALQCHWHLEPTARGRALGRRIDRGRAPG